MRSIVRGFVAVGLFFSVSAPLMAQGQPARRIVREQMIARRAIRERVLARQAVRAQATGRVAVRERAAVATRRAMLRERIRSMTPAQRQQLRATRQALRTERQRIGNQLRNGSITQEQARQSMQSWRREHRPNLGLRGPRRPDGGEF